MSAGWVRPPTDAGAFALWMARSRQPNVKCFLVCRSDEPRYLKVAGRWRDHQRWAMTINDWQRLRRRRGAPSG